MEVPTKRNATTASEVSETLKDPGVPLSQERAFGTAPSKTFPAFNPLSNSCNEHKSLVLHGRDSQSDAISGTISRQVRSTAFTSGTVLSAKEVELQPRMQLDPASTTEPFGSKRIPGYSSHLSSAYSEQCECGCGGKCKTTTPILPRSSSSWVADSTHVVSLPTFFHHYPPLRPLNTDLRHAYILGGDERIETASPPFTQRTPGGDTTTCDCNVILSWVKTNVRLEDLTLSEKEGKIIVTGSAHVAVDAWVSFIWCSALRISIKVDLLANVVEHYWDVAESGVTYPRANTQLVPFELLSQEWNYDERLICKYQRYPVGIRKDFGGANAAAWARNLGSLMKAYMAQHSVVKKKPKERSLRGYAVAFNQTVLHLGISVKAECLDVAKCKDQMEVVQSYPLAPSYWRRPYIPLFGKPFSQTTMWQSPKKGLPI